MDTWLESLSPKLFKALEDVFPRPNYDKPVAELEMNQPVIATTTPMNKVMDTQALLNAFCTAIRDFEGAPGDRNYRNNNPGNCRYSSVGYARMYGTVKKDKDNFAIFSSWDLGWTYLKNLVKGKATANPSQTLVQFFHIYAPSSDGNNPDAYAAFVGKRINMDPKTFTMKNLLS